MHSILLVYQFDLDTEFEMKMCIIEKLGSGDEAKFKPCTINIILELPLHL